MRAFFLLAVALSLTSFAQTKKPAPKEILFGDGDLIEVDPSTPDVEYVRCRVPIERRSLMRVREDFKEKVMASVHEL